MEDIINRLLDEADEVGYDNTGDISVCLSPENNDMIYGRCSHISSDKLNSKYRITVQGVQYNYTSREDAYNFIRDVLCTRGIFDD